MLPVVADGLEPVRQNVFSRRRQFWIELLLGLTVLASAIATWWYQGQLTLLQQVAAWSVMVLTFAVL